MLTFLEPIQEGELQKAKSEAQQPCPYGLVRSEPGADSGSEKASSWTSSGATYLKILSWLTSSGFSVF